MQASIGSMIAMQNVGVVSPVAFMGLLSGAVIIAAIIGIIIAIIYLRGNSKHGLYDSDIGAAFRFSEILD